MQKKKKIEKLFGIIGNPLVHSYSQTFFREAFAKNALPYDYEQFLLSTISELPQVIANNPLLKGLNVTIPYKEQVIPYLNELSDDAKAIGAVNVVKIEQREGKPYLIGYNSDWIGFMDSIKPLIKPHHQKALILGTGGASKAITYALEQLGITSTLVSRTPKEGQLTYSDLCEAVFKEYTVIVNTTPVGTFPNVKACMNIPYQYITNEHLVYDLIYNPVRTLFLHQAETKNATISNGWMMFVNQALRSWEIWEGKKLNYKP